jgi:GNAT superfamily N-acetyltransferase
MEIIVRLATLADTSAITEVHKSDVPRWERVSADGRLIDVPYESLSLYERWQHGGPWLSVETCAVHLNRLLAGSGIPLVAEIDGKVLAEAEVYESFEPPPFGHNLELSVINVHAEHTGQGLGTALVNYVIEMARLMKCERVTIAEAIAKEFYEKIGFRRALVGHTVRILTQAGRVFYQAADLTDRNPDQVKHWYMPLGRYRSSRQEWDRLFPQDWAAGIPELLTAPAAHVKLGASGGHNAILYVREADEIDMQPGDAHITCWAARPLTKTLLAAIRDWAFRNKYQTLITCMMEPDLPLLAQDGQPTGQTQDFYEFAL